MRTLWRHKAVISLYLPDIYSTSACQLYLWKVDSAATGTFILNVYHIYYLSIQKILKCFNVSICSPPKILYSIVKCEGRQLLVRQRANKAMTP